MALYENSVKDSNGTAINGAKVYVYQYVTGSPLASLLANDGGVLGNPLTTDEYGNYGFNAADGLYTLKIHYGGKEQKVIVREQIGEPDLEALEQAELAAQAAQDAQQKAEDAALAAEAALAAMAAGNENVAAINADGWSATVTTAVDLPLSDVIILRSGYNQAAEQTYTTSRVKLTKRVRQAYPNQAIFTADKQALSNWVFSDDILLSGTNNSSYSSPKPIMRKASPDHRLVGNSIYGEDAGGHLMPTSAGALACIKVTASDGTNTVTTIVTSQAVSAMGWDAQPVTVWPWTIDVTSLANGALITVKREVYPWFGGASSVLNSNDVTSKRAFTNRYFWKDATRFASPPLAEVSTTGNDSTGVWSTNAATAAANPFLTIEGAFAKIYHASFLAVTGGYCDGCKILIGSGSFVFGSPTSTANYAQKCGAVIITRKPGVARASAIVQLAGSGQSLRNGTGGSLLTPTGEGHLAFVDVTVQRTGTGPILTPSDTGGGTARPTHIQFENVNFDNGSQNATFISGTNSTSIYGMTLTNMPASATTVFGISGTTEHRQLRGVSGDLNGSAFTGWQVIGCNLDNPGNPAYFVQEEGCFQHQNVLRHVTKQALGINGAALTTQTVRDVWIVGNTIDFTGSLTSQTAINHCSNGGHSENVIIAHNVGGGYGSGGRWNVFYCGFANTGNTNQNHALHVFVGNIPGQLNVKLDKFTTNAAHIGAFAFDHGVGCSGIFTQFAANAPTTEHPAYAGINSALGTSSTVRTDPLFTDYQGTTGSGGTAVAGTGGSNFRLQSTSPARGLVDIPFVARDLDGSPWPAALKASGPFI